MPANIAQFTADIDKFVERLGISKALVMQKIALDLWKGITFRTPVDTGRARANWMLSVGSPSTEVVHTDAKGKGSVPAPAAPDVSKITGDESIFIVNNLAYIEALENGHSQKQAPNGMVKLAIQAMEAQINRGITPPKIP